MTWNGKKWWDLRPKVWQDRIDGRGRLLSVEGMRRGGSGAAKYGVGGREWMREGGDGRSEM